MSQIFRVVLTNFTQEKHPAMTPCKTAKPLIAVDIYTIQLYFFLKPGSHVVPEITRHIDGIPVTSTRPIQDRNTRYGRDLSTVRSVLRHCGVGYN